MYKIAAAVASPSALVRSDSSDDVFWPEGSEPVAGGQAAERAAELRARATVSGMLRRLSESFLGVCYNVGSTYDTAPPDFTGVLIPPPETAFNSGAITVIPLFDGMKLPFSVRNFGYGPEIVSGGQAVHNGTHWYFCDQGRNPHQCLGFFSDENKVWAKFKYRGDVCRAELEKAPRQ